MHFHMVTSFLGSSPLGSRYVKFLDHYTTLYYRIKENLMEVEYHKYRSGLAQMRRSHSTKMQYQHCR
jgi:hypothetical protein